MRVRPAIASRGRVRLWSPIDDPTCTCTVVDYRFQIARRYLASRREVSLISIITGISMTGVTLGVAALIVVLSVMNGFYDFVRDLLVSVDPHVRVVSAGERGITNADSLRRMAQSLDHVTTAAPYVEGKALFVHQGSAESNRIVQVRGVESDAAGLAPPMVMGAFDVGPRPDAPPGLVMDRALARRAGLVPGGDQRTASTVGL